MPFGFPSHPGLILPLWRLYPRQIDSVALCVGAVMPDVVDGLAWFYRADMGQWFGHSLAAIPLACVPLGAALSWVARRLLPAAALARLDEGAPDPPETLARSAASVAIGALSHIFFDLISHGNMVLFLPWYRNDRAFPEWWTTRWGSISFPIYKNPYIFAPYTVAWVALTIAGAVLFFTCLRRRAHPPTSGRPPRARP